MKNNNRAYIILIVLILIEVALLIFGFYNKAFASTFTVVCPKGEVLFVRDIPDKKGTEVAQLHWGYEVDVSEIVNQFAHVTMHDGSTGWCDISYLEKPIQEEIWVVNTSDPLNKRETPDGRYLTRIKGGSRISVFGWRYSKSGELWAKVYRGGYVNARYLSKTE